ncbi:MAG TPA: NADPH:quinone oxidoreductase family protein [Acidimicrobiales bacterium]|nr:NADPH:quinone oxidoreductase family protein [Acidimicrobiales bacterium]
MRRVVCRSFGPLSGLDLVEEPDLVGGDDRVVVDVAAAGANFVDALIVEGRYQMKPPLPFTPGMEVAGTVEATGERVLALCWMGGYASQVIVPRAAIHQIPDGVTMGQAATLIQSYATAQFALTRRTTVREGEWVAVLGAGGGVGLAMIDVARSLGARVVACASSAEKLAAAQALGADAVVAYEDDGVDLKSAIREATGGGADVVVDPVGGDKAEAALRSLRWHGRYVVIGFASGEIPSLPVNQVLLNNRTIVGVDWGAWTVREPLANAEVVAEVLSMVAGGQLHPVEPIEYPLDDVVRCLDDLESRRLVGKAVLVP